VACCSCSATIWDLGPIDRRTHPGPRDLTQSSLFLFLLRKRVNLIRNDPPPLFLLYVLGPVPGVGVMAKMPQGLLNVGTRSARMAVLRSCALDI
jgi:hypothetical protein